jgi:TatD DNase family protein
MTPVPVRGKRNEPANIVLIGRKIAEALGISEEEVARSTTENALRLCSVLKGKNKIFTIYYFIYI